MKKKKWIMIIAAIIVIAVLGIGSFLFFNKGSDEAMGNGEPMPIQVRELSNGVSANGQLFAGVVEPKETQKIMLEPDRGKVAEIFVKEGDEVKSGTKLFSYNNQEGQLQLKEKSINVEMSAVTINQKKKEMASFRQQINKAASDEKKELQQQLSQSEVDLKVAELEAQKVRMDYEEFRKKMNDNIVTAKVNGIVQKIDVEQQKQGNEENGQATAGSFMQIVNTENVYVKGTVNELVKDELKINQKVSVVSRKDPEKKWSGKIVEIGKLPSEENAGDPSMDFQDPTNPTASNYPFKVQLDDHEGLDFGYHVFIELTDQAGDKQEVVLPSDIIVHEDDHAYVWKVKDGALMKQKVELGKEMEDGMMVVIQKGLSLDDYILFPEDSLKEGKKVTIDDSIEEH
ncbi:HlyD family secretion protein [Oikeobacillus pervagus]|uniref:HlyD family secretion protein n=1 Tax=Oikeobacillus pervagus TaxID=1325931 RepID=A0AAJ1SY43_9BACI|nr:biotin/lipoyl-binding protein [Oikeobacillus pervagus]MDQ0214915.1 HlyD family secretion protein [Oikeobacillus pervagus]